MRQTSDYHIAEAGANPISQTAFTLANGFAFVEYYLARGMNIDDFAPNLSFFNDAAGAAAIGVLKKSALEHGNIFESLMEACKQCSLGQLSQALYEVGGQYRRNM